MPKIRTIDKGYQEYKETIDPDTCESKHSWRQIIINRKLKSVRQSGNRWLYDLDEMIEYLKNPPVEAEPSSNSDYGTIRAVR